MKTKYGFSILFCFIIISCRMSSQHNSYKTANHLLHENSPYLLQHAYNPVDWYPWGDEALKKAKDEQKMILVSIGYSACHWCHVMEHESFEDSTVAAIMNEHFVCIKVDREERPDIDDVYMTACQLVSERGCGWPLNAFALPDGRPIWAGTYFPKEQWMNILDRFGRLWPADKEKMEEYASKLTEGIKQQDQLVPGEPSVLQKSEAQDMATALVMQIDKKWGGRKGAPKFPMPTNYDFLLQYYAMSGDENAYTAVRTTLDNIAMGGIYDQLGGGFARYSVDEEWLAPHFEKMLYDNGQLLSLYARAYQVSKEPLYRQTVEQTVGWLDREMTNAAGGFYSSLDADSEGEEGKFYVWTEAEVDSLLPAKDLEIYKDYYDITSSGNWEHKNIMRRRSKEEEFLAKHQIPAEQLKSLIQQNNKILFAAREKRIRPGLDDKILTSWNALALTGLINCYRALGDSTYLERALKNARFIKQNMLQSDYRLLRNYKDGQAKINAFLDDYAMLIEAFLQLYQVTFDVTWLHDAEKLLKYTINHFYDSDAHFFNYTSDLDPPLIARKKEIADNVIPGSNSVMARNLHYMGKILASDRYVHLSDSMLYNMIQPITSTGQTGFYSNWALLYLEKLQPTFEVAVVGKDALKKSTELQATFLPNSLYVGGETEGSLQLLQDKLQDGRTMIYVCQNKVCQFPVEEVAKALSQIKYTLEVR